MLHRNMLLAEIKTSVADALFVYQGQQKQKTKQTGVHKKSFRKKKEKKH